MEHILFKHVDTPDINRLSVYVAQGGYNALKKTVTEMKPEDITKMVSESGLAGRGGAGFPTGRKWSFIPKGMLPTYMVINADESEPGAFKDRELMERNPHQLLEGVAIASYAIGCQQVFIYIRGEFLYIGEILDRTIAEANAAGYLGQNIFGSGFNLQIIMHRGAGSTLGSASFIVIPNDACIIRVQLRISEFFAHETCGKCIPCREGTPWLAKTVRRIENGLGREEDLPLLLDICDNMLGRVFCALGDFATSNIVASMKYFFDEYEEHIRLQRCPFS